MVELIQDQIEMIRNKNPSGSLVATILMLLAYDITSSRNAEVDLVDCVNNDATYIVFGGQE